MAPTSKSLANLRREVKLRQCICCGESKPSLSFNKHDHGRRRYDHCIDCGRIMRALSKVSGITVLQQFRKPKSHIRRKASDTLWNAWHGDRKAPVWTT
jgi:hypothetical protein